MYEEVFRPELFGNFKCSHCGLFYSTDWLRDKEVGFAVYYKRLDGKVAPLDMTSMQEVINETLPIEAYCSASCSSLANPPLTLKSDSVSSDS